MRSRAFLRSVQTDSPLGGKHRFAPGVSERLFALAAWLFAITRPRAHEKRAVRDLRRVSDATLKDIGIRRSEILFAELGHRDRGGSGNGGATIAPKDLGAHGALPSSCHLPARKV